MRVLVYGLSSDKLGGIETFLLNMNKFMSDDMIFDYVIEGKETIHRKDIEKKGGKCYFIAPKKKMLHNIKDWIIILRNYKKTSDVIYFNMYSLAWSVPIYIALMNRYKVIVHAHNNSLHDCGMLLKTLHRINRKILDYTTIIRFTNSGLSATFFYGNKNSEMIYNAIDTQRFAYNEEIRERLRKQLNVQDNNLYGFSGRLAYQKNPLFLMDIFAEIKKIDNNAAFIVCGDGDLAEQTKNKAKQLGLNIIFTGNVNNIQNFYNAMDCYILPSRFEGLGIVLIEAQCSGLPCITSSDVVPQDAKVTPLLNYLELSENAAEWAQLSKKLVTENKYRQKYAKIIYNSPFEIRNESVALEKLLRMC